MRPFLLFGVCLCAAARLQAQSELPYSGYINSHGVAVRSGPGEVHYATDQLERGTKIEVYRNDPGGWCAVRPPDGSFSWVPADKVRLTDESGIGEVIAENVKAWVGSRVHDVTEPLWQVRLKKAELVELLSERPIPADSVSVVEKWYKIAPPAGEFRWIHQKFITPEAPSPPDADPIMLPRDSSIDGPSSSPVIQTSWSNETVSNEADGFVSRSTPVNDSSGSSSTLDVTQNPPPNDFPSSLRNAEVQLSLMLAQQLAVWDFALLRREATALLGQASTDLQRGQAHLLLEKIAKFETLKLSVETKTLPANTEEVNGSSIDDPTDAQRQSTARIRDPGLVDDIDPRFDGAGFLVPVHTRTPSAPSYALLDADGNVLQYVTPAPGFNLNRYLRQEIGLYGQRGFIPHLNVPHLTAHRVVVLDRHRQ